MSVASWRKRLDAKASSCDKFEQLNTRLVGNVVKEVNTVPKILVSPEHERQNGKITGIGFSVEQNAQRSSMGGGNETC